MSKQIRLEDDIYERIRDEKEPDESFSDAVERLIGGRSFRDLRDVFDDEAAEELRAAIDAADRTDRSEARQVSDRFE